MVGTDKQDSQARKQEKKKLAPTPETPINQKRTPPQKTEKKTGIRSQASSISEPRIPKMMDFGQITEKVKRDERQKQIDKKPFTLENLLVAWRTYTEKIDTPLLKMTMSTYEPQIDDQSIVVKVGSTIARESILAEKQLLQSIRSYFHNREIVINVIIDESLIPPEEREKPKSLYTAKEKWDIMIAKNPALAELKSSLNLQVDED